MPAFLVDATPGTGPAPDNAVPVTLWGAGSGGGGGDVEASDVSVAISQGALQGAATDLQAFATIVSQVLANVSATQTDLNDRVTALEA